MAEDELFRWFVLAGMAVGLPMAIYHYVRAYTGEKLDRRQEGLFVLVSLRLAALAVLVGLLAYVIEPRWMAWSSLPLPASLRWSGVVLGAATAVLLAWSFRTLGKNLTDTVVTRREHT